MLSEVCRFTLSVNGTEPPITARKNWYCQALVEKISADRKDPISITQLEHRIMSDGTHNVTAHGIGWDYTVTKNADLQDLLSDFYQINKEKSLA